MELDNEKELLKLWERIDELRILHGYSWQRLSAELGNKGFGHRWGKNMSMTTVFRIAEFFQVEVSELFPSEIGLLEREEKGFVVLKKRPTGTVLVVGTYMDLYKARRKFVESIQYHQLDKDGMMFLEVLSGDIYAIKEAKVDYEHVPSRRKK